MRLPPSPLLADHPSEDCEVIVLGSSLAGLIAAALLAKERFKVLLLKERRYSSSCLRDGYRFFPFSNFSEKRLRPFLLRRVSQELGLSLLGTGSEEDSAGRPKERVSFQVILPRARIDLFDDLSLLKKEWKREFPEELPQIEAVYDEFHRLLLVTREKREGSPFFPLRKRSFFSFLSLPREGTRERLSSLSKEFNQFVSLQLVSWGALFSETFSLSLAAHLLLHEERGEWHSEMSLERLEKKILDHFLQSGGEIEEMEQVEGLDRKWGKGFTLILEGDRRIFHSKSLILNGPLHAFADLLGKEGKVIGKWLKKIRPRYLLFPSFFGIREKVVPCGMGDLLVSILDLEKPYEEGNALFLGMSAKGDEGVAPEGRRALTVLSPIPFRRLGDWNEASFTSHQEAVMRHLNHVIPFLEQSLEFADFDWGREQMRRWSYPHFLYEAAGRFDWREGIVPTRLSKDLYFTGKENFPYLGVEGEVLSGLMVAEQILKEAVSGGGS